MNSIVVGTFDTAKECIKYLKDQRCEPQTFLALDTIDVYPIKESLRQIQHAHLVIDIIKVTEPAVKKAVQFACDNSLVVDDYEVARQLAYGSDRHKVVTLTGTLLLPSGVIKGTNFLF